MRGLRRFLTSGLVQHDSGGLFGKLQFDICRPQVATIKYFAPPQEFQDIEWPENRKLNVVAKAPTFTAQDVQRRMRKMISLMRGPEHVHNFLIYKQYGIQALTGGRLKPSHFEFFRNALMKKFDYNHAFLLWRVDPPWQAVSKKSSKRKMGGGKGSVHHYVTPVRAGRIILELGGTIHPDEVKVKFGSLAENMPFPARFVTQEMLEEEEKMQEWQEANNLNPYTFKYVILNNMGGCNNWLSRYDYLWFGKYK